jgi:hypothetical protein
VQECLTRERVFWWVVLVLASRVAAGTDVSHHAPRVLEERTGRAVDQGGACVGVGAAGWHVVDVGVVTCCCATPETTWKGSGMRAIDAYREVVTTAGL